MNTNETPPAFERRSDGVYIGADKVAHIVDPGGHVRMAAGKSDLREMVLAFLEGKPTETSPAATPAPAAEVDIFAGSADVPATVETPAPVVDASPQPAPQPEPAPLVQPVPEVTQPRRVSPAPAPRDPETIHPNRVPSSPVPPKPDGAIHLGDKDPAVIDWYRQHDPAGFARRYKGTKWENR